MISLKNLIYTIAIIVSIQSTNATIQNFKYCNNNGEIALTFDDGPNLKFTDAVLDVLKRENVKATFFINGKNCVNLEKDDKAQKLIKREIDEGHIIASHTYTHPDDGITQLNEEQLTYEMKTLNDLLYELYGITPAFFRPPKGEYTEENAVVLEKLGFTANILWNLDSLDWDVRVNSTEKYFRELRDGSPSTNSYIVLNHDIKEFTATKNLDIVIPYIKSLGYKFVTVDQCVGLSAYQNINSLESNSVQFYANSTSATVDSENKDNILVTEKDANSNLTNGASNTQVLSFISVFFLIFITIFNL